MLKPEVEALHQELVLRAQHIEHIEDIEKRESEKHSRTPDLVLTVSPKP